MTQEQLRNFNIEDLMKRMMVIAPDLWRLMETLHAANSRVNHQRAWTQKRSKRVCEGKGEAGHKRNRHNSNIEMTDVQTIWEPDDKEEEHYWRTVEADEFELIGEEEDELEDIQDQEKTWFEALAWIVSWIPLVWSCIEALTAASSLILYLETSAMHQYYDA